MKIISKLFNSTGYYPISYIKCVLLLLLVSPLSIFGQVSSKPTVVVKTIVTDFEGKIREGEQILFVDIKSNKTRKALSDQNGKFNIDLPYGTTQSIKIKSIGEAHDYSEIVIPTYTVEGAFAYMELTIQFEFPKTITLNNVYFDSGKSSLKPSSFKELDELVELMKLKKKLRIEIGGHTDNIGEDEDNLILSSNRAKSVKKYLISHGTPSSRIQTKGYGESQPIADNATEKGRQKNRRTEVKILSE